METIGGNGAGTARPPDGGSGATAFDFLFGNWRVRHRKLRRRLAGCTQWDEFEGESTSRPILGGLGNIEENVLDDPGGAYRALALRLFDPARGAWSIWWVDGRHLRLEPPVHGRFQDGAGLFIGEDRLDDRPILVRFLWSAAERSRPRWEQAFSADGGGTWETNWIMRFERPE
ncbi:MAG TPA: DUF1579 domain-containing protein [Allosphingosinicella sp.]|nr:DUF1579 domain-containing protein [Allosphingosinicella sp.]